MTTQYATIADGVVISVGPRPNWLDDDGDPVSDAVLKDHGRLPLVDEPPAFVAGRETIERRPLADWSVGADDVHVTYDVIAVPLAERQAQLMAALAARRWQFEVAGFVWQRPATSSWYFIATDEISQGKIAAERKAADGSTRRPGDIWKCGDAATGQVAYVAFSDAEIVAMSDAARNRTSDGFNHEAVLAGQIVAAADHDDLDEIDINAGWPG